MKRLTFKSKRGKKIAITITGDAGCDAQPDGLKLRLRCDNSETGDAINQSNT